MVLVSVSKVLVSVSRSIEIDYYNCCHQMSDFKAKMHQIRFLLEIRCRPLNWGASLHLREPIFKRKEGRGWDGEGTGEEAEGREGMGMKGEGWFLVIQR